MIIKINDKESYNIDVPEEVEKTEFLGIMQRLNRIVRLIDKEEFSEITSDTNFETPKSSYNTKKNKHKVNGRWTNS